jgi:hypothetical protein
MAVFWIVTLCSLVDFTDVSEVLAALMMEVASTSVPSVNVYQTTQRKNPEDSPLHICRRENLKSHLVRTSPKPRSRLKIGISHLPMCAVCLSISFS